MQSVESKLMSKASIYNGSLEFETDLINVSGYAVEPWYGTRGIIGYVTSTMRNGHVRKEYWKYA